MRPTVLSIVRVRVLACVLRVCLLKMGQKMFLSYPSLCVIRSFVLKLARTVQQNMLDCIIREILFYRNAQLKALHSVI